MASVSAPTLNKPSPYGTVHADLGVKMVKFSGVIKGRFYMTTSLSDSWEAFTPLHAGATLSLPEIQYILRTFENSNRTPECIVRVYFKGRQSSTKLF